MKSIKKTTFISFLFLILIASYLSYQIGKDAASRDARVKANKNEMVKGE